MVTTVETLQLLLRIALALAFAGMGVLHFLPKPARQMAAIIPPALRREGFLRPATLVAFTGLCEIAGAVGILLPPTQLVAGLALVLFLVAVFPANSYAAKHPDRFGAMAIPFWPRYFGQLLFILLVLLAVV
ncbi:MAG: DoxX family rane protein [Glaciihabitans sp.]|nr:DoxX family rane protein [Glaciihabitans sp.]